jgi:tripartite-type tricarboxylate transporter receptor subunit TctC
MNWLPRLASCLAVVALATGHAFGQAADYPNRTVTVVVPTAPGGILGLLGRLVSVKSEQRFGKTFVIEHRPGGGTSVGATSVARATPDGYTLLVGATSTMATNVTLHKKLLYNPATDLAPIILLARVAEALVVTADLPVNSIDDLVKLAKATPGGLNYGSAGPGTAQHLEGEMLKAALGIELTHVPYKAISPALNDVAGGHIPMMFAPVPIALPLIQSGKVRALGVTTIERVEALPDARPLTEIGVRDFDAATWFMLAAPARTPNDIIEKLYAGLFESLADPELRREMVNLGLVPVTSPKPDALKQFVEREIVRYGKIVEQAGLAGSE